MGRVGNWACSGHAADWAQLGPILWAAAWNGLARAVNLAGPRQIALVSWLGRVSGPNWSCG